jgi:hypothetical protein
MGILRQLLLILLLAWLSAGPAWAGEPVGVAWAFFLKDGEGQVKSLGFDAAEGFAAGDLLRIYLQLQEKTYVYLYLDDSRGDLYLVFPPTPDFYGGDFPAWQKFYIPSGRGWFTLDSGNGKERFYLLATNHRLIGLEGLTDQFLMDREDRAMQARLLAEIKREIALLGQPANLEQSLLPVPYSTGLGGSREPLPGSFANQTKGDGDFSLVFELSNP